MRGDAMMRALFRLGLVLAVLAIGGTARADAVADLSAADRGAIRQIIEAQLAAFRADDGTTAFSFASPMIQTMFGDPARFMTMVRTGYMPVYRPREVEFQGLIELRGQPTQLVLLVGPENEVVTAHYLMERQPDGTWRINGCILRPAAERAA
jgi:hypothetical protein